MKAKSNGNGKNKKKAFGIDIRKSLVMFGKEILV